MGVLKLMGESFSVLLFIFSELVSFSGFKTPFYWTLPCLRDPSMARAHMDNFPYRVLSHSTNTRYNLTQKQYVKQDTKVQQFKKCTTL